MRTDYRLLLVALAMCLASALAVAMKPTKKIADLKPRIDLERVVPAAFGGWRIDTAVPTPIVNPEQQRLLDRIYGQTLTRTYVNDRGERIMLSIAYGGDQSDAMQVHRPEVCYPSQGFVLLESSVADLPTPYGSIPIKRLVTRQGMRNEPVTYWITVGDRAVRTGLQQKLSQLAYGLTGRIPDGMLVRVSSIDPDHANAYRVQDEFIRDMLDGVGPDDRVGIIGRF